MAEKLTDLSCTEFARVLAAKESVPGGGGAAALVGALGVALGSMVGNFTTGKKRYAEYEGDIQRMLADGEAIRTRLIELVAEDAEAFYPLSQAYGIPKEDPTRAQVLEEATKNACAGPVEMMRQICRAIELLEEMGQKGLEVKRFKGLGEMNPSELWETTMDPERRYLHQVTIENAVEADRVFSMLMGDEVPPRREFIERNAHYADIDA